MPLQQGVQGQRQAKLRIGVTVPQQVFHTEGAWLTMYPAMAGRCFSHQPTNMFKLFPYTVVDNGENVHGLKANTPL